MLEMERSARDAITTDPNPIVDVPTPVGHREETATAVHDAFTPPPGQAEKPGGIRRLLPGGRGGGGGRPTGGGGDEGQPKLDLRNTWQVAAGAILIPLGVIFILLGWYGAAHARVVQQQIPYMVSGSFIGLGCMVLGGLFFWGHWLYRVWDQADLHHEEQMRVLEELVRVLGGNDGSRVPQAVDVEPGAEAAATPSRSSGPFYSTASGTVYHQADCPIIAHHPNDLHVLGASALAALRPCQICCPD